MVTWIDIETFGWTCNNIFDVLWEHLEKIEMNLMNMQYQKMFLK